MSNIEKVQGSSIISILHGKGGALEFKKPFEQEIFLFDTHVAGTSHVEGILDLEGYLKIEEKLNFFREPQNPHDPQAIVIKTTKGIKIGYVPRVDNIIFARLMDAGKILFGRIIKKEIKDKWVKIDIKIFLLE